MDRRVIPLLAIGAAAWAPACHRAPPPPPAEPLDAGPRPPPTPGCSPLADYCRPSDAVLLWGRCAERWAEELVLACATSPSNVEVSLFADCQEHGVASQRGADFARVLYYDAAGRLSGVEESFQLKHCYGEVPALNLAACAPMRRCGGSAR